MANNKGDAVPQDQGSFELVDGLQKLTGELQVALDAIAVNDRYLLTESIRRQEELCASLVGQWRAGISRRQMDAHRDAIRQLAGMTAEYQLVIEASLQSASLLSSLYTGCSGYPESSHQGGRSRIRHVPTMMCEA